MTELLRLTAETAPALVELFVIGPDTAATLLVTAGANAERLRSEAEVRCPEWCEPDPCLFQAGPTAVDSIEGATARPTLAFYRIVGVAAMRRP